VKRTLSLLFVLAILSHFLASSLTAKGRTRRITLTCAGSEGPIELTDTTVTGSAFGPWGGQFLDTTRAVLPAPPRASRQCEVAFYVEAGPDHAHLAYVVYYRYTPGGGGYIYLPGRGDPWYEMNVGTILRDGRDGRWSDPSSA
jgi:hypothetical protein